VAETHLRESQIQDLKAEKTRLEGILSDPKAQLQERGAMQQQVRQIDNQVGKHAPPSLTGEQLDAAVREEREHREKLLEGMPSQEEMRKSPPGAIGKHLKWDRRAKEVVNERGETRLQAWKNRRLELHRGSDDPDVANFEIHRPRTSTLNMDNAFIPGAVHSLPSPQFSENYDKVDWGKGMSAEADEMRQQLKQEISDLRKLVTERNDLKEKAKEGKPPAKKKAAAAPKEKNCSAVAACGKEFKATVQYRADFGKKQHEKNCQECKSLAGGD
jgi:hypothetical protein